MDWRENMDKIRSVLKAQYDFKGVLMSFVDRVYPVGWVAYPSPAVNDNEVKP